MAPPRALSGSQRRSHGPQPASSRCEPAAAPGQQALSATRLVALALSGESPIASSAGYEISEVIPPAVPMMPASTPAASRKMTCGRLSAGL
jgi:hypothetical protein